MTNKKLEVLEFDIKQLTGERGTVSYAVVRDENGEVDLVRWMDPGTDIKSIVCDFASGHSPAAAGFYATGNAAKALYDFLISAYRHCTVAATAHPHGRVRFYNRHIKKPSRNLFRKY